MECYDFQLVSGGVRCVEREREREREREALARFKKGLIDESGILSSWGSEDSKKDCCKWKGVVCSNTNTNTTSARVIALLPWYDSNDYPYTEPLGGKISAALLELHHLTNLDLSMNEFDDQFPQFMGSMQQLEHLNLFGCFLHGTLSPQLGPADT
ncbi:hypothetical protein AAHA92_10123 [Salvia divinorum]|uniref:Leucine-rich repeat-containing N-terminal plant-type domain-containing protein n=1 Tax=Salvia divinorum TaxID=28513 RepID=A0ABD1HTK4_SALDI